MMMLALHSFVQSLCQYTIGIGTSLSFLTRIPVPTICHKTDLQYGIWAFAYVGMLIGSILGITASIGMIVGIPSLFLAVMLILLSCIISGALHEDGLADTCDGFFGGHTPERRITIMRDSHHGVFGVIALIATLSLRTIGLYYIMVYYPTILWSYFIISESLSRLILTCVLMLPRRFFTPSSGQQQGKNLSYKAGQASLWALLPMLFVGLTAYYYMNVTIYSIAIMAISHLVMTLLWLWLVMRKLGFISGDTLGALQQLSLILCALLYSAGYNI